jgi:hypothetical protein
MSLFFPLQALSAKMSKISVVRQAYHEREKANKSNKDPVHPELVEG